MKVLATSLSVACLLSMTGAALAQSADYINENRAFVRAQGYGDAWRSGVAANGRCGGISYGTGSRGCGTATGGPVGGLSSRN